MYSPSSRSALLVLSLIVPLSDDVKSKGLYNWRGASFSGFCVMVAENSNFCKGSSTLSRDAGVRKGVFER